MVNEKILNPNFSYFMLQNQNYFAVLFTTSKNEIRIFLQYYLRQVRMKFDAVFQILKSRDMKSTGIQRNAKYEYEPLCFVNVLVLL